MELKKIFSKVFFWMFLGLAITFVTGYIVSQNPNMLAKVFTKSNIIIMGIVEIGLVIALSAFIHKMSPMVASMCFIVYSFITGLTFGSIFVVYDLGSIIFVFGITAVLFLIFALLGHFTNIDLTKFGVILLMLLIGIIICSIINLFVKSEAFNFGLTVVGLLIFLAYVAYDIQVIKKSMYAFDSEEKVAIYGALQLYIDFINIFLRLLRLFASERN